MSEKNKMKSKTQTRRAFGECRPSPRTVVFSCMICKSTTLVGNQLYTGFRLKNRQHTPHTNGRTSKKCNKGVKTKRFFY